MAVPLADVVEPLVLVLRAVEEALGVAAGFRKIDHETGERTAACLDRDISDAEI